MTYLGHPHYTKFTSNADISKSICNTFVPGSGNFDNKPTISKKMKELRYDVSCVFYLDKHKSEIEFIFHYMAENSPRSGPDY
jgi:hypothetical protein